MCFIQISQLLELLNIFNKEEESMYRLSLTSGRSIGIREAGLYDISPLKIYDSKPAF